MASLPASLTLVMYFRFTIMSGTLPTSNFLVNSSARADVGCHAHRIVGSVEVLLAYAFTEQEAAVKCAACFIAGGKRHAQLVDGVEHFRVQVRPVQRLQRVKELRMLTMHRSPDDRDAHEFDVGSLGGLPALERRIERVAVSAAVPEDFVHLDLASAHIGRLRSRRELVVGSCLPLRSEASGERAHAFSAQPLVTSVTRATSARRVVTSGLRGS